MQMDISPSIWPTVKCGLNSRTGGLTDLEDFVIWHTLKHTGCWKPGTARPTVKRLTCGLRSGTLIINGCGDFIELGVVE